MCGDTINALVHRCGHLNNTMKHERQNKHTYLDVDNHMQISC